MTREIEFRACDGQEQPFDWDAPWVLAGWRVVRVGTFETLPNGAPSICDWSFAEDKSALPKSANDLKEIFDKYGKWSVVWE